MILKERLISDLREYWRVAETRENAAHERARKAENMLSEVAPQLRVCVTQLFLTGGDAVKEIARKINNIAKHVTPESPPPSPESPCPMGADCPAVDCSLWHPAWRDQ